MDMEQREAQRAITRSLGIASEFDAGDEIEHRVDFLARALLVSDMRMLALGISGGVDSLTAGRLSQLAVERVRAQSRDARFVAMRLPYGMQHDAVDAERALQFIGADETLRVDIRPAVDVTMESLSAAGFGIASESTADFVAGNVRARQRMIVQYAVANARRGLVVGTDHAAEAVMGFFTKHGDGACDLAPLAGLTKRRVRAVAIALGAPVSLAQKIPTADLEALQPMKPDEVVLGVTYEVIDDFLEGQLVSTVDAARISDAYRRSGHKRTGPAIPGADAG
jgi:NAD+ synthase